MAGLAKSSCSISKWKAVEWRYLLYSKYSTPAVSNPSPSTTTEPPVQALVSRKKYISYKRQVLRENRENPELEKKARINQLYIPLNEVKQEWMGPRGHGVDQLRVMGLHSHIYQDAFGMSFLPHGFLGVSYSQAPPTVMLPYPLTPMNKWGRFIARPLCRGPKVNYVTLTLTNPDGHLLDSSQELLHWMVANVPVVEKKGDRWKLPTEEYTVIPYLAPVPPSGTGLHRFVFTLYTHTHPLHTDHTQVGLATDNWLRQRMFSSSSFLAQTNVKSGLQPFSFCYFQTHWDSSVQHTYKHILKYPEPVYNLEKRVSPRKLKQREVYATRQANYTLL